MAFLGQLEGTVQARLLAAAPVLEECRIVGRAADTGDRGCVRVSARQFRMIDGAVVALAIVLPHELPVALLDDRGLEGDARLRQLVRSEIGCELLARRGEVRSLCAEADEDISLHRLAVHTLETELGTIEPGAHLARGE